MRKSPRSLIAMVALMLWTFSFPGPSSAQRGHTQVASGELTPEDTVILANHMDARFSRDYSALLELFASKPFECAFHLAALPSVRFSFEDPQEAHDGKLRRSCER